MILVSAQTQLWGRAGWSPANMPADRTIVNKNGDCRLNLVNQQNSGQLVFDRIPLLVGSPERFGKASGGLAMQKFFLGYDFKAPLDFIAQFFQNRKGDSGYAPTAPCIDSWLFRRLQGIPSAA